MNLEIYRKILEKSSKYGVSQISVQWAANCSMQTNGKTDTQDEAKSRFLQFCERVYQDASCCATPVLPTITTP